MTPRTLRRSATAGGLRMELRVSPKLPGPNRFELQLAGRGRPVVAARVQLVPRIAGMVMLPFTVPMSEVHPGQYVASGPLAMFGRWTVTVRIDRPGEAPLSYGFTLGLDLPKGLLAALGTQGAPNR